MYEGGGDWDEENDRDERDYGRANSNSNSDKGLFSWTEDSRNGEADNVFENTLLVILDIINGDFRVNFDNINIRSGGDGRSESDFGQDMAQEYYLDEPPINLFGPNEKRPSFNGVANSRSYRDNDGKFNVFGHGGPGSILDGNKYGIINNVDDFDRMMMEYSPNWEVAKDKKGTVLSLWLCSSTTGNQNIVPFAAMISKAHPNITVIGVDGYLYYVTTKNGNYKIGSSDKKLNSGDGKGEVVSYKNGKEIYRSLFSDN